MTTSSFLFALAIAALIAVVVVVVNREVIFGKSNKDVTHHR